MKKYIIIAIDILTIVIIILHIQSLIYFITEEFSELHHYDIFEFIQFHRLFGAIKIIRLSDYYNLFLRYVFFVYLLNIVAIKNKIRYIKNNDISLQIWSKYTIILNITFITFKTTEYLLDLNTMVFG